VVVKDNEWVGHESGLQPSQRGMRREGGVLEEREDWDKLRGSLDFCKRVRGL
jgi:hypothetical protein